MLKINAYSLYLSCYYSINSLFLFPYHGLVSFIFILFHFILGMEWATFKFILCYRFILHGINFFYFVIRSLETLSSTRARAWLERHVKLPPSRMMKERLWSTRGESEESRRRWWLRRRFYERNANSRWREKN